MYSAEHSLLLWLHANVIANVSILTLNVLNLTIYCKDQLLAWLF